VCGYVNTQSFLVMRNNNRYTIDGKYTGQIVVNVWLKIRALTIGRQHVRPGRMRCAQTFRHATNTF